MSLGCDTLSSRKASLSKHHSSITILISRKRDSPSEKKLFAKTATTWLSRCVIQCVYERKISKNTDQRIFHLPGIQLCKCSYRVTYCMSNVLITPKWSLDASSWLETFQDNKIHFSNGQRVLHKERWQMSILMLPCTQDYPNCPFKYFKNTFLFHQAPLICDPNT